MEDSPGEEPGAELVEEAGGAAEVEACVAWHTNLGQVADGDTAGDVIVAPWNVVGPGSAVVDAGTGVGQPREQCPGLRGESVVGSRAGAVDPPHGALTALGGELGEHRLHRGHPDTGAEQHHRLADRSVEGERAPWCADVELVTDGKHPM